MSEEPRRFSRMVARRHRLAWLRMRRDLEPSIAQSVDDWCFMDLDRFHEQEELRSLNIPIDGFISNPPPRPKERRRYQGVTGVGVTPPQKQSVYVTMPMLAEWQETAERLGFSMSRVLQLAWTVAKDEMRARLTQSALVEGIHLRQPALTKARHQEFSAPPADGSLALEGLERGVDASSGDVEPVAPVGQRVVGVVGDVA